eukprot:3826453-Amphidinium_carterae.2
MFRVRSLGLLAHIKARIVKSFYSVGLLWGGGWRNVSFAHMNDVRMSAHKALGKGASLRSSSPLELMAFGDPQVTTDLNTIRLWQRRLDAGLLQCSGLWMIGYGIPPWLKVVVVDPSDIQDCLGDGTLLLLAIFVFVASKECRQVELPADDDETPACTKLHGLLPAPRVPAVISQEPVLGLVAVRLSTDDVGLDIAQTRMKEHECQPHAVVNDCKGGVKVVQALQTGRRTAKGRNPFNALLPGQQILWMKAHQQQTTVDRGMVTADDLHGNGQADVLANQGIAVHGPLEPDATWTRWADFANKVCHLWCLVGPQLQERPEADPRVMLPAPSAEQELEVGPK